MSTGAKPKASTMSFKVSTAHMRTEFKGSLVGGVAAAFYNVPAEERPRLLADLQQIHEKLTAHEAKEGAN